MITYAIGDIHGCLKELAQLVLRIQDYHSANHTGEQGKYVFVGDYIDRGPDSKGVIDYLIDLSSIHECVFLRGNHEDMFLHDLGSFMMNGGYQTLTSYGWNAYMGSPEAFLKDSFPAEHMKFIKKTVIRHRDELRLYVHAGIIRHLGNDQSESTMLWVREQFLRDDSEQGGYVVHGHTPVGPELKKNRCNVDSACVFGHYLTAAVFDDKQVEPLCLLKSDTHVKPGPV